MEFRKLLVATDGSPSAIDAVNASGALAARLGAEVIVMHVLSDPGDDRVPEELRDLEHAEHVSITRHELKMQAAQSIADRAADLLRGLGVKKVDARVVIGDPATQLVAAADREKADLVVMGRRGLGRLGGLLLGSVTHKVTQLARVPCMTVG